MQTESLYAVIGIIGTAGTIIGVILTIYFYLKSIRAKKPCWAIRSNTLIQGYSAQISNLKVTYADQSVENLTISRILFWNKGAETINGSDIAHANPLRIKGTTDNVDFLNASILVANNPSSSIEASISPDHKSILLAFDYLDQSQGAVIQVIHTGVGSTNVEIVGDMKGVRGLKKTRVRVVRYLPFPTPASFDKRFKPITRRRLVSGITLAMGLLALLMAIGTAISGQAIKESIASPEIIVMLLLYGILAVAVSLSNWWNVYPRGLEVFEDDF